MRSSAAIPLDKDNVFIVTGDSGMGMTHGTIAGILLTDLILGRENPWATLYDPSRKTLRAAGEFAERVLNMAAQYTDWLTRRRSEFRRTRSQQDSGAVLRRGLTKVAVYRDEKGRTARAFGGLPTPGLHRRLEPEPRRRWDCPCHGSRFDKLGKVINGPANKDLAQIDGK